MLEPEASHHLAHVLRKKAGSVFSLFNGDGREFSARISDIRKRSVTAELTSLLYTEITPNLSFTLLIAISKGERLDFALQKAVELGIDRIIPLISERTVVRLSAERLERKMEHWGKIIISACEQSGRCRLPDLWPVEQLNHRFLNPLPGKSLLLDHRGEQCLNQIERPRDAVNLLVGPEGGLSDAERAFLEVGGVEAVRLGPRVLRTETAPLAALAAMQMLWGDFRSSDQ